MLGATLALAARIAAVSQSGLCLVVVRILPKKAILMNIRNKPHTLLGQHFDTFPESPRVGPDHSPITVAAATRAALTCPDLSRPSTSSGKLGKALCDEN